MKLTCDSNIKDSLDIIQRFFKAYIKCTWILMSDVVCVQMSDMSMVQVKT